MTKKFDKNIKSSWEKIHKSDLSWRSQLIGEIDKAFVIPRYVDLFYSVFGKNKGISILELGAGNGELSQAILAKNLGQISYYLVSENYFQGAISLASHGLPSVLADAQMLPFCDHSFDGVVVFDVMHHVDHPHKMALEMMRVGGGRCLLVESNGLSIFRKLLEYTPGRRAAGERSYSPWAYRHFFERQTRFNVTKFTIFPFLFPFKCPHWFLPTLVTFNQLIEKIPILRWQCSSVAIVVEYDET